MVKSISPLNRLDGRAPLTMREAVIELQSRLQLVPAPTSTGGKMLGALLAGAQFDAMGGAEKTEESVTATITNTKLLALLGKDVSASQSFRYRSKATITGYNLPVVESLKVQANIQSGERSH